MLVRLHFKVTRVAWYGTECRTEFRSPSKRPTDAELLSALWLLERMWAGGGKVHLLVLYTTVVGFARGEWCRMPVRGMSRYLDRVETHHCWLRWNKP